jgi:hypothetical protein
MALKPNRKGKAQPTKEITRREYMDEKNIKQKTEATTNALSSSEIMDMVNDELSFLRAVINLLQAVRHDPVICGNISFFEVSGFVFNRMELLRNLYELLIQIVENERTSE